MSIRVAKTKKFLFALMLSVAFTTNVASANLADDIKNSGVGESVLTENYTFNDDAGALAGSGRNFTIKGAAYSITGGGNAGLSVVSGQTLTIQDVSSISNFITDVAYNGGFLTNAGTVNINALNNNITFTSNKVNGVYNDVYNTGTINLNAGADKSITFGGSVAGSDGVLSVNEDATIPGGTYVFKGDIDGQTLKIYNGATIKLDGNGVLKLAGFEPNGQKVTLDLRNNSADLHDFGKVVQNASVNHLLDVNISDLTADRFAATSTTATAGHILIGGLHLFKNPEFVENGNGEMIVNLSRNSFRFAMGLTHDILSNISYATDVSYRVDTVDYDMYSGNLIFNAAQFEPNGGMLDRVYATSRDYLNLGIGEHKKYYSGDLSTTKDPAHPDVVILEGIVYYFKADENGNEELTDAIRNLAATGSAATKEVLSTDNWIFNVGSRYYTYTTTFLPKSMWELEKDSQGHETGSETNYTYYTIGDNGEKEYHKVKLRTDNMNAIDTTHWDRSTAAEATNYSWKDTTTFPLTSNPNYVTEGTGTGLKLKSVDGMIRFYAPYNGGTEERYYKYTYTVPFDYEKADGRIPNLDKSITNEYFYGISNAETGAAIYNNSTSAEYNINTDFINNSTSKDGGAIYNHNTSASPEIRASLGYISGTFINNQTTGSANGGVIFNNKGYIRALMGDFIGNSAAGAGGVLRNVNGTIDMMQGRFIGNKAGGYGGVISNKVDPNTGDQNLSKIEIILGDFIANSAAKGGGAIDMNGHLGTVIGDFIGNAALGAKDDNGGGAIRTDNGLIDAITGDFIGNITGMDGGAILNYASQATTATLGSIKGDFIGNRANRHGGAISNWAKSDVAEADTLITEVNGNFLGNSSGKNGGAIYNLNTISHISGDFIANKAGQSGSAIYNSGTIKSINGNFTDNSGNVTSNTFGGTLYNSGTIDTVTGSFTNNKYTKSAGTAVGGAIYNTGTITSVSGDFTSNSTTTKSGGAIYNTGTITLASEKFTNNSATENGGAIYNAATNAIVNINAINKNTLFSGNTANSVYNDIYNAGTINLNAGTYIEDESIKQRSITFNGTIYHNTTGNIEINKDEDVKGGSYIFNNYVGGTSGANGTFKLYNNADIKLGNAQQNNNEISYGRLNVNGFTNDEFGGIISTQNGKIDCQKDNRHYLGSITLNSDINLKIDADLSANAIDKRSDTFNANSIASGTAKFVVDSILVKGDSNTQYTKALMVVLSNLKNRFALSSEILDATSDTGVTGAYKVKYDGTTGYLLFANMTSNLVDQTRNEYGFYEDTRTYNMNANEDIATDITNYGPSASTITSLGELQGTQLTINGNGKSVSGSNKGGISVGSGQALTMNNIASVSGFVTDVTNNGGFLTNAGTVNINAGNNNVAFSSNKVNGVYNDVYNTGTINLNAAAEKNITFDGAVTGTGTLVLNNDSTVKGGEYHFNSELGGILEMHNGAIIKLGSKEQADSSTTYGTLNLTSLTNDANGGLIDSINDNFDEHNFRNTTLLSDLNFKLDMNIDDLADPKTDKISATYSSGSGEIVLSEINLLGSKSWNDFTQSDIGKKIKILTSNSDSLQLGLSDDLAAIFENSKKEFGSKEKSRTPATIQEETDWVNDYYKYTIVDKKTYGKWDMAKTSTENDSLGFIQEKRDVTRYESMGDALALVNQADLSTRNFKTDDATKIYTLTPASELGETKAGNFTIQGAVSGSNISTVNLNNKAGFALTNATNLTLTDVKLTGANGDTVTLYNENAKLSISANSIINGSLTNTKGTVENNGRITGNVISSGTLSSALNNLEGSFINNGMFNLNGQLTKNVSGEGTTVLGENQTVTTDREIEGILNVNGKTLGMNDNAYKKLTVGKLTGNGNLTLNVNANDNLADEIHINNSGSDSVLTITTLNLTAPTDIETDLTKNLDEYEFSKQILTGSTGDAKIVLGSGAVDPAYNVVDKEVKRTGTNDLAINNINWKDNFGGWEQSGLQNNKVEIVGNDTIKYSITKNWNGEKEYTTKAENLAIMNTYTGLGSDDRKVNFAGIHADATAQGTYTVKSDIGASSAGKFTLNGERIDDSNTVINLDNNAGFTLSNATELTINNIDMSGNTTLISVSNENAKVNLKNTNMQGAITGTKEFDLKTTEANVLQNVTKAKVENSGNLSLSGTNNLVNISNAAGETELKGGETTVGSINQKSVTIAPTATKLTVINGITTTTGVTNNKTNGLEILGGTINSDISGAGSVNIVAGTETVFLTDSKTISQQVDLKSGTFNTNANGIGTGITLSGGDVELTGGTLSKDISGTVGITTIKTGNVSITEGSIGNNVVIDSGSLTSDINKLGGTVTNNATFNMIGNLSKNITGSSGTTILQSASATVTDGTTIAGTLNVNGKTIAMNNNDYETLNVGKLTGTGNLTLNADASTTTGNADTINITGTGSDSVLTITALNMTTPASVADDGYTYLAQIITGTPGTTTITLADNVIEQYASNTGIIKTGTDELHTNAIKWDKNYGEWTENGTQTTGVSIVEDTKLQYQVTKTYDESTKRYTGKAENLAIMNQYDETGSENREVDFEGILSDPTAQGTYTVNADFGETKAGNFTIKGETNGENRAVIDFNTHSGFELNNNSTTITLKDVEVKGANDVKGLVSGTAGTDVKVSLDNVNIHDNGAGINTAGNVEIKGNSHISDEIKVLGANSKIDIDGSETVTLKSNITGTGTSKLNISNGTVNIGKNSLISSLDTTLNNTTLNLASENSLNGLNVTFEGTNNLNLTNNSANTLALDNVNLNGVLNMQIDADLANAKMDQISASSATIGAGGRIDVSKINLMSPTTEKQLDLLFTDNATLAGAVNYTGEGQIVYSPIYKYNTSYVQKGDGKGYFSFASAGNTPSDFNPAVMAAPVSTIVTGYQNQMQALQQGFYHMDRYMKYSDSYRFAAENQNKYASLAQVTDLDVRNVPETSQSMWVIPYTSFERVNLSGVGVDNIAYGMTYGGDSDMFDMGHGFKGVISGFIGYNGNHMNYNNVSMTQNGGFVGATLNAYKGNFFTGLSVSTGASAGDAETMYGHDSITLLTAGIANKTGYNFEFLNGKVIVQPSLFLGYSWVNTFDYTNAAGVRISQDPLNALQIIPGVKVIGNTKSGWQPYAGVDMVWNVFMGRNQTTANDVVLPKLSERAYVQYGVGIQKTWADRFTGFLQAMVRNGGRNGIVLSAGFRWTFGKAFSSRFTSAKNKNITKQNRTVIKQQNKK